MTTQSKIPTPAQLELLKTLAANANNVIVYDRDPWGLKPTMVYFDTFYSHRQGKEVTKENTRQVLRPMFYKLKDADWLREGPDNQWRITDSGRACVRPKT